MYNLELAEKLNINRENGRKQTRCYVDDCHYVLHLRHMIAQSTTDSFVDAPWILTEQRL